MYIEGTLTRASVEEGNWVRYGMVDYISWMDMLSLVGEGVWEGILKR